MELAAAAGLKQTISEIQKALDACFESEKLGQAVKL